MHSSCFLGVHRFHIHACQETYYAKYLTSAISGPQQHGGEEAWTTIKAQNYKRVRKLLDGKKAKKAKLMDTNEDVSGPSEAQLAEAEVLCDLMAVPQEYLRRVLADIYQVSGHTTRTFLLFVIVQRTESRAFLMKPTSVQWKGLWRPLQNDQLCVCVWLSTN